MGIFSTNKWSNRLPKIRVCIHKTIEEVYKECSVLLEEDGCKLKVDRLEYYSDFETDLEAWYMIVVSACGVFMNYIKKGSDEDCWLSLLYAVADKHSKRSIEKNINIYMEPVERYSHTGYPITEPEKGKGVTLLAKDVSSFFLKKPSEKNIKRIREYLIEKDKQFCSEIATLFGDEAGAENIVNKTSKRQHSRGLNMFNW
ncbi:MAG: hypothetical protein SCK57_09585 [Bacillota bacterium]|nr:hypothetical protein [Bacillota bacterium]